ncbi:MAG TPA: prepilin-type N-terminal cleavage/methylation domain-containing protein [Bacillota bacterium]|nr:prepilin-type N-terminal cleavage/methylation domain-containing protein [Peptococcaceae bacterium MAG4]NLW38843.1 prepilin-type N-terminal cleavage/methylation domain-containing protein [Peptococcaceae bacterium]HPZ42544.1 prepilin-type N-terminal cleavage/methylation domain-containing protein [Bacillota bacterium]HQD76137.1 prepilin-type N-terminal cleavage/methylation domain-containing protein [Bacillota bacterium]HUM57771.1 prepilin-type N-terminal cleavage/methylation domain-containing p
MSQYTGNRGYTLVEAMVALTIFAIVVTAVLSVYLHGHASYLENNHKIEVQENLRIALNKISRDLRQAKSDLKIYKQDGSLSNDGTGTQISFLTASGEKVMYCYDQTGKEVELKIGATGSPQPVVSNIEGLEFQYNSDKKTIVIYIKGKKQNHNPPVACEMSTKVQVRAL